VLAYPINLEAFARGTQSPDFDPDCVLADTVSAAHPSCAAEMTEAYRAISSASALILDGGGEVMRPRVKPAPSRQRTHDLEQAYSSIVRAIDAANYLVANAGATIRERGVWHYSRAALHGIMDYLAAAQSHGHDRQARSSDAVGRIGAALLDLRASASAVGDTWASWDLDWISDHWLNSLRRRFDDTPPSGQDKN
jgi:hypothetical protein